MADIKKLVPIIFKWEGGIVNDPVDKGGATNMGVTLATFMSCGYDVDGDGDIDVKDLNRITPDDVVDKILRPHYWNRWKADKIKNQSIANIVVDWVWASGKHGITKVQELLGVTPDGIVGEKTIAALNNYPNQAVLFYKIWQARLMFIESIVLQSIKNYEASYNKKTTYAEQIRFTNKKYECGWKNRLKDFKYSDK